MVARASIFEGVQLGLESTPGTGVAANRKLLGISINPKINAEINKFRPIGSKFPTVSALGKEWVTASIEGIGTYNDPTYLLASLINNPTPVQQGATPAWLWTFNPDSDGPDDPATYTVEQGSSVRAHEFSYGLVSALEFAFSRSEIAITGEMIGRALSDGITMTGAPTSIALVPVLPTQVDIFLATSYAGLAGASALERAISASWAMRNRYGMIFPLATAVGTSFDEHLEIEPELQCKLKMEANSEGMALLSDLRDGDTRFMRILAVGAVISGAYTYRLQIDTALKVMDVSEFSDEDGLVAVEWTLDGVHDATWGQATQVQLTNTLTAL